MSILRLLSLGGSRCHWKIPVRMYGTAATASSNSDITTSVSHLYKTPASTNIFSDISRIDSMSTRELRVYLSDVVLSKVDDVVLWSKVSEFCIKNASKFKFFDALSVLLNLKAVNVYDKVLWIEFARTLSSQAPQMEPFHIVNAIEVYSSFGLYPEGLFMELFYNLIRQADRMYSHEFVSVFVCLAKHNINNQQLLTSLCRSLSRNITILRYHDLALIMAAVKTLNIADETFYFILDSWQQKELKMMTIQELFDTCKILSKQQIKWKPYEDAVFNEFLENINKFESDDDIDQLDDPFNCLDFLRLNNCLSKEYLLSLSRWCSNSVYKPPTRSQNRPLSYQLVQLYNLIKEYDIDDTFIDKAILKFVTSKGGLQLRHTKPIPTRYRPNRRYVYTEDINDPKKEEVIKYLEGHNDEGTEVQSIKKTIDELSELWQDIISAASKNSSSSESPSTITNLRKIYS